jgi:hypothetical protein
VAWNALSEEEIGKGICEVVAVVAEQIIGLFSFESATA